MKKRQDHPAFSKKNPGFVLVEIKEREGMGLTITL